MILCKLDRGFRSASDCLTVLEALQRGGISLHIVDPDGNAADTASASRKFTISLLAASAEMDMGLIRDRCNSGRPARKAQGKRVGKIRFRFILGEDGKTLKPFPMNKKLLQSSESFILLDYLYGRSLRNSRLEVIVRRKVDAGPISTWLI